MKAVPFIVLSAVALITLTLVWTRQPAPAGERGTASSNAHGEAEPAQQATPPTAAEPSAALSRKPETPAAAYGPGAAPKAAALTAEQLTDRAKAQLALDPEAALSDIQRADQLAGPQDETRRVLEIHALVRLGKVGMARSLTDRFYRNFPGSDRAAELERLTGYHPRPGHP